MNRETASIFRADALEARRLRAFGELLELPRTVSAPIAAAMASLALAVVVVLGSLSWPATRAVDAHVVRVNVAPETAELAFSRCNPATPISGRAYIGRGHGAQGSVAVTLTRGAVPCLLRVLPANVDAMRAVARLRIGDEVQLQIPTGTQGIGAFVRAQFEGRVDAHAS